MSNFITIDSRLHRLRALLKENDLDALIVTRGDEHLSEYLSSDKERLAYITGFTGSAGTAVIATEPIKQLKDHSITVTDTDDIDKPINAGAVLFVDGRYTIQADIQTNRELYDTYHFRKVLIEDWLSAVIGSNKTVGIDPKCVSFTRAEQIRTHLAAKGINLVFTRTNLIDSIWLEKQKIAPASVEIYDNRWNGCPSREKRHLIASLLREKGYDCTIISSSESVNWLLNVRGRDIPCLPVVSSFAAVYSSEHIEWYVDPRKIHSEQLADFQHHFGDVDYFSEDDLFSLTERLGKDKSKVYVDPESTNAWLIYSLKEQGAYVSFGADLCELPKACKNPTEVDCMKKCHLKDAVAMCRFLAWLDHLTDPLINKTNDTNKTVLELAHTFDEASISDQLEKFRREQDNFIEPSFDTISALGSNGSIVHYNHKNLGHPKALGLDPLYLVDSGGHYLEGTTDITRTILVGPGLTKEMKDDFTLVLKGLIALHSAIFPKGTYGIGLDVLARSPLWQAGLDFDHGTGHGVGQCLNVHEGPQSFSPRGKCIALQEGMITSIEPGYYKNNEFGIRCENLSVVEKIRIGQYQTEMMTLKPITFVPFDIRLINKEMLTTKEKDWLNNYHMKVRDVVKEHLSDFEISWLLKATAAI